MDDGARRAGRGAEGARALRERAHHRDRRPRRAARRARLRRPHGPHALRAARCTCRWWSSSPAPTTRAAGSTRRCRSSTSRRPRCTRRAPPCRRRAGAGAPPRHASDASPRRTSIPSWWRDYGATYDRAVRVLFDGSWKLITTSRGAAHALRSRRATRRRRNDLAAARARPGRGAGAPPRGAPEHDGGRPPSPPRQVN